MKSKLFIAVLLLPVALCAIDPNESIEDSMLKSPSKPKQYDKEVIKAELTETMDLVDALATQVALAHDDEVADIWLSGNRDFKIDESLVKHAKEATLFLVRAQAADHEQTDSSSLRSEARDQLRDQHKTSREDTIRDLRNWLSVSEGSLRRANEARALPTATATATPSPTPAERPKRMRIKATATPTPAP